MERKKFIVSILAFLFLIGITQLVEAYTILNNPGELPVGSTTIDFQSYPVGTVITNQYPGVGFSPVNGTGNPQIDLNETGGGQGLNGGPGDPTIYTYINQDAPLLVTFLNPVVAAGAFYIDLTPLIGRGFFYDKDGGLITTFILDQEIDFWGLKADPGDKPIGSILFDSSGGYPEAGSFGANVSESYTIDNLAFSTTAAPEPTIMLLLGSGLLGLWGARKKFKK